MPLQPHPRGGHQADIHLRNGSRLRAGGQPTALRPGLLAEVGATPGRLRLGRFSGDLEVVVFHFTPRPKPPVWASLGPTWAIPDAGLTPLGTLSGTIPYTEGYRRQELRPYKHDPPPRSRADRAFIVHAQPKIICTYNRNAAHFVAESASSSTDVLSARNIPRFAMKPGNS